MNPDRRLLLNAGAALGAVALMGDALAVRLLDAVQQVDDPAQALRPAELYAQLEADVWSELGLHAARPAVTPIAMPRRALQREHVNRLAFLVLRPTLMSRPDARALLRQQAGTLATRLEQAARQRGLDETVRLHLKDCADTLRTALSARMERLGA